MKKEFVGKVMFWENLYAKVKELFEENKINMIKFVPEKCFINLEIYTFCILKDDTDLKINFKTRNKYYPDFSIKQYNLYVIKLYNGSNALIIEVCYKTRY